MSKRAMVSPDPEPRPRKRFRFFGPLDEVITLIVGGGDDGSSGPTSSFIVHKSVLCGSSPFFAAACKPEWMKSEERAIKLPIDDPEAVEIMVCWMYEGQICMSEELWKHDISEKTGSITWEILVRLWLMADKYRMQNLQNDTVDAMLELFMDSDFHFSIIPLVWQHTSDRESPLRKLMLCFALYTMQPGFGDRLEDETRKHNLGSDFLLDMDIYSFDSIGSAWDEKDKVGGYANGNRDVCKNFHEHDEGEEGQRRWNESNIYKIEQACAKCDES